VEGEEAGQKVREGQQRSCQVHWLGPAAPVHPATAITRINPVFVCRMCVYVCCNSSVKTASCKGG
jgi:hypothetical protein